MQDRRTGEANIVSRDEAMTLAVVLMLTALLGVIGFLAASTVARSATRTATTISLRKTGLGSVLVNAKGHTIYLFAKDKHGKSACTGQCAGFWPPLIAVGKPPLATAGAKASLLGTIRRGDGRLQVTYNHHPLYTFVKDTRKGQTNGEGVDAFGAEWYAVSAAGAKVEKTAAKSSGGSDPAPGGYGY